MRCVFECLILFDERITPRFELISPVWAFLLASLNLATALSRFLCLASVTQPISTRRGPSARAERPYLFAERTVVYTGVRRYVAFRTSHCEWVR
jgi:hypothetical protein